MKENDIYTKMAQKLGAPASRRFLSILEEMFIPEEVEILLELFAPATCQEVASRLNIEEKGLASKLDELADRGVITRGKTQFAFHSTLMGFHHDVMGSTGVKPVPEKLGKLWGDFFRNEWCDMLVSGYIERQQATGRPVHRVWPAIGALEASPNIRPEQILPEEDFRLVVKNAKRRIFGQCGCRGVWGTCDYPTDTCFACFDNPRGAFFIERPWTTLKEYSEEETLAAVRRNEQAGLVHIGACFCCTCCCEILYSLKRANRFDLLGSSRYRAVADEKLCVGCQDCVERCPFSAIEMLKTPASKKLKASVNRENCKGCGVCIVGCEQKALTYELVEPPEYILAKPDSSIEVIRSSPWGYYNLK